MRIRTIVGASAAAGLFWLFVTLGSNYVTHMTIPLNVQSPPPGMMLSEALSATVEVTFEGSGWQLLMLRLGKKLALNLSDLRVKSDRIVLTRALLNEALDLPYGVVALGASPETIAVQTDVSMEKRVPVRLVLDTLTFREQYGRTGPVLLEPDSVTLRGAARIVRSIDSWPTQSRGYQKLAAPVDDEIALADSLAGLVFFEPPRVRFRIPVEQLADAEYQKVKIVVMNVPSDKEILLAHSTVDIFVRSGVGLLSRLSIEDFRATIDYKDVLDDTTGTIAPKVVFPENVILLRVSPPQIRYTIRK